MDFIVEWSVARKLSRLIFACGVVTGLTVFLHQLPLIYELVALFDRLFLFFIMLVSLLFIYRWCG